MCDNVASNAALQSIKKKNSTTCATPSGSRKHFSDIRRQEYYHLFRQGSRELRVAAATVLSTNYYFRRTDENPLLPLRTKFLHLGNASGWRTSFRRTTIFVVQTKILYYHYAQSFFLAPKMITIIKKICFSK